MSGPRIAVSGYYGCGNTGDEAVLAGILEGFQRRAGVPPESFCVLSADPESTARLHGVRSAHRMRLGEVRSALLRSDLLLSGGGSLLQDTTSLRSLAYYVWIIRLALAAGRPVMLYAQGVGPLRRSASRFLTRIAARRARCITVRDQESAALLRAIGVSQPQPEVTADPAFALSPAPPERARAILAAAGAPADAPLIGFAFRPWPAGAGFPGELARAVERAAKDCGAHPVLIPFQPPGDLALAEAVARAAGVPATVLREQRTPGEMLGVTACLEGLLAMRLHALIFAAVSGVPSVAAAYDPKVGHLMRRLGRSGDALELAGFRGEEAGARLAERVVQRETLSADLRARAREMAALSLVNVDRALAVCGGEA